MKITKRQLRRIIKEEKSRVLKEYRSTDNDAVEVIHNALDELLGSETFASLSPGELEHIADYHTGSDFDKATQSLAKIALANLASDHGPYREG